MRNALLAAIFAAAFGVSGGVKAADIYSGSNPGAGPYLPPNIWAGFYGGVNGGYAWNTGSDVSHVGLASACGGLPGCIVGVPLAAEQAATSPEGGFGGGQIGYNWQAGSFVFGLETDFQGAGVRGANTLTNALPIAFDHGASSLDWFGTVRGRLGFTIFDSGLLYATGGFAYGSVEDKVYAAFIGGISQTASSSQIDTGYVAGVGLEYSLTPSWSFKVEYQYMNLGDTTLRGGTGGTFINPFLPAPATCSQGALCLSTVHELDSAHAYNTVRIGLNYHIVPAYAPLK